MSEQQNITVNVERGGDGSNHGWTVLGTLLLCGALGMAAWAITNAGALDLAATGLSFFFVQLVMMMFKAGLIVMPEGKNSQDFAESRGILKTLWRDFQAFQANSPIWRMALLALGFTIGYLVFRLGLSLALGVFSNIWIAGAASALIASLIVSPKLFSSMFSKMKTRTGVQIHSQKASEPDAEGGGVA